MKKLTDIDYLVDKLGCSIEDAKQLIEFDKDVDNVMKEEKKVEKAQKVAKPKKAGIQDEELLIMMKDIQDIGKPFQNKDLKVFLDNWKLTARQTPSRLKKLVESGLLEDMGGSPKTYQVATK